MDEKETSHQAEAMKRLAFFSISVSTLATVTAIILIPSIYTYLQHVQSILQNEVDFCQHRTNSLFEEFSKIDNGKLSKSQRRKRDIVHRSSGISSSGSLNDDPNTSPHKEFDNYGTSPVDFVNPQRIYSSAPALSPVYGEKKEDELCSCGVGPAGLPVSFYGYFLDI